MSFIPKKIDKETSKKEVIKWASISEKKKKEYIPYPFENWIKENLDWGESFNITKEDWLDHINEIRKKDKKPKTKSGPSIFMMMKSKVDDKEEGARYNTIEISKWMDEETKTHKGWKIRRLYYPHVEDEKTIKKREERYQKKLELEKQIEESKGKSVVDVKGPRDVVGVVKSASKNGKKKGSK
jgi:hypothetical protein